MKQRNKITLLGLVAVVFAAFALVQGTGCIGKGPTGPAKWAAQKVRWHGSGKRVVGYFTNWAQYRDKCKFKAQHIDATLFTHINYSFAKIDPGLDRDNPVFRLAPFEHNDMGPGGQYSQVTGIKRRHPHLKVLLAVGGWSFNDPPTDWIFTNMVSKKEYRDQFIRDTIPFLRDNNFDGLDLDWEFPADPERGGRPEDTANFTAWVEELRQAFREEAERTGRPELLLTMAASAGPDQFERIEFAKLADDFDWINVMTYDFYGSWSDHTGALAPFLADTNPEGDVYVKSSIQRFLDAGVPPNKIVMGIPTYGRNWAGVESSDPNSPAEGAGPKGSCTGSEGFLAFYEVQDLIESGGYKAYWDKRSGTPYAYNPNSKVWISYDDLRSIKLKVDYIEEKGLGGAMFWAIDLDDFQHGYPLIRSVAKRLRRD